uniref:FBA_2 domain-containing protein n=1 Tax=Caenorhabditis tropicalis TaxID=1561998 RepID=A0A1I7UCB4_9PELO
MAFPLLQLPYLPCVNIINLMEFSEQVTLSLCSRKAYSIIKTYPIRPQSLVLRLHDCIKVSTEVCRTVTHRRALSILLGAEEIPEEVPLETVSIKGHTVPARIVEKGYLETYWEKKHIGLQIISDYVCDLFRVDLGTVSIRTNHRSMFDWVHRRQSSVGVISIVGYRKEKVSDDDLEYMILNSKTDYLKVKVIPSENFRMRNFNKKLSYLAFFNSFWMTMDDLMALECISFESDGRKFTNEEVNQFLKYWMNGGSPRLKQLGLDLESGDPEVFLDGLMDNVVTGAPKMRDYLGVSSVEFLCTRSGLRRNDGVIASFCLFHSYLFRFGVWPDAEGNTFE